MFYVIILLKENEINLLEKLFLPDNLVSKQIWKQDWRISQTLSFVNCDPIGLNNNERRTLKKIYQMRKTFVFFFCTCKILIKTTSSSFGFVPTKRVCVTAFATLSIVDAAD